MRGGRIDAKVVTRMGDGTCVERTGNELRADIEDGVRQGAKRAKVPPLTAEEIDHLLEIFASEARMTGVPLGDEVVLSCDGSTGLRLSKLDSLAEAECVGGDLCELQQDDYSYQWVKTAVAGEQRRMREVRRELGLGRIAELENECVGEPTAMEAKSNIAELLGLPINCVERFRERARGARDPSDRKES